MALAALLLFSACRGGEADEGAIRIGFEGPLTGDEASNGLDMLRGAQLAVDEAKAAGGVLGRQIELVPLDDRGDPEEGRRVAREAVDERLFAVIGPYHSAVGVENLPIYVDGGVIPIHLTSNSATNGMGFTVQPKDYQIAPIEADAIVRFFRARRVAIVHDPQTYTAGIAEQLRSALQEAGVEVVAYEQAEPGRDSYLDLIVRIGSAGPDLVYASTYFPQGGVIARELLETGLGATCFMGLANQDPGFVTTAGLDAARSCSSSGVPAADQFGAARRYVLDYRTRFDADPATWGTFTYDSVRLLFDAVRRAGTWHPDAVREALAQTNGFEGVTGSITIDPDTGNRVDVPVVVLQVDEAGLYVVDPDWAAFAGFAL